MQQNKKKTSNALSEAARGKFATGAARGAAPKKSQAQPQHYVFPLGKSNFIIMGVAAAMIVIGFVLISGGGSENGDFNPEIFSTTRIVIGPLLAFLGFVAMGVGIMWNDPKKKGALAKTEDPEETVVTKQD